MHSCAVKPVIIHCENRRALYWSRRQLLCSVFGVEYSNTLVAKTRLHGETDRNILAGKSSRPRQIRKSRNTS